MNTLLGYKRLGTSMESIMFDRGQVLRNTTTGHDGPWRNALDERDGGEIKCSVDDSPDTETGDGAEAPVVDALLRVPLGTDINALDRFRWTKSHGTALGTPQEYTVISKPRMGASGLTVKLKIFTGNSEN